MVFQNALFIKPNIPFTREFSDKNSAPMFRRKFQLSDFSSATLRVCGLGYAYYYVNGEKLTDDLFTAPVSDYNKTLWYNEYDVTHLLRSGENTIAVIAGNGFYNETIATGWKLHEALWRDNPKFILELYVDGDEALVSDGTWKCNPESAVYFNQLRMGEYYDANICSEDWMKPNFPDCTWGYAKVDDTPPSGIFRKCECEPIREARSYSVVKVTKINEQTCVYDFGQNMSGYARVKLRGNKGDEIQLRYSECIGDDGLPIYYGMDKYYLDSGFQTDKIIASGEPIEYSPRFAYHGFRYIEVSGVDYCDKLDIKAIFVHQDVKRRTGFECSDEYINRLFDAAITSSYSNMFYVLTDCPTREKLGWANDAQSSCEQMLTNFEVERLLAKWHRDIKDAMKESGELPGIIPTAGWGYHWGNGPVSDGILFEIPYRIYLHTGDPKLLIDSLEYFDRYFDYLETRKNEDGLISFGLDDWAAPKYMHLVETEFINAVLIYSFYKIAALAARLQSAAKEEEYLLRANMLRDEIKNRYISRDGKCTIDEQCSVAMLIYYDLYDEIEPLREQLRCTVERTDYHLKCGMVGMRRLLHALSKCGLDDCAMKLLCSKGYPGYGVWMDGGATTLWEKWDVNTNSDSKNHHMYSDFASWLIKTLGGVRIDEDRCGELEFIFSPIFIEGIEHTSLSYMTKCGRITVYWERCRDTVKILLTKDKRIKIKYNGKYLEAENNEWSIKV